MKRVVCYKVRFRDLDDRTYDELLPPPADPNVDFVLFSNAVQEEAIIEGWRVVPPVFKEENHRRAARKHKCLSHILFPEASWTLWLDGVFTLRHTVTELLDEYSRHQLTTHRHPSRVCAYQEARSQKKKKKDRPELFDKNVERMRLAGFPEGFGLAETGAVLRRHTEKVRALNLAWWKEIADGCVRDQVSFDFCRWRLGIGASYFRGTGKKSPHFEWRPHHRTT